MQIDASEVLGAVSVFQWRSVDVDGLQAVHEAKDFPLAKCVDVPRNLIAAQAVWSLCTTRRPAAAATASATHKAALCITKLFQSASSSVKMDADTTCEPTRTRP